MAASNKSDSMKVFGSINHIISSFAVEATSEYNAKTIFGEAIEYI